MPRSASRLASLLAGLLCLLLTVVPPTPLAAQTGTSGQVIPLCVSGCGALYAVEVTPDGQTASQVSQNTQGNTVVFTVVNTGESTDHYAFSCTALAPATCAGVSPSSATLGGPISVTVTYNVGTAGTGRITLKALGDNDQMDTGYYTIPVVTTPQYAVTVTPPNVSGATRPPATSGLVDTFTVTNTGTSGDTYSLAASCLNGNCFPDALTPVTLAANGGSVRVLVRYATNSALTSETLRLTATSSHASGQGQFTFTIASPQAAPVAALRNQNDSVHFRPYCLTAGGGEAAAVQCGDLLMSHGLPGFRTLGKDRSLTLLYNSDQARPSPVAVAWVTEGVSVAPPASVYAQLSVNLGAGFVQKRTATYGSWGNPNGVAQQEVRQIALSWDAVADNAPTGAYPFQLLVRNQYSSTTKDTVLTGTFLVVNRSASPMGTGWALAGIERLYFNQPVSTTAGGILRVEGDGSALLYQKLNDTTWLAPRAEFRDSIILSGGVYTRCLRHGVKVTFDAQGRQTSVNNRMTQVTQFYWRGTGELLDSIRVPPDSISWRTYKLGYDAATHLDYIDDPVGRRLDATVSAGGQLTTLTDPSLAPQPTWVTTFTYDASGRLLTRASPRGYTTTYVYGNGLRVTKVVVPRDSSAVRDTTAFQHWDEYGLNGAAATDSGTAHTVITGPRRDVAEVNSFWLDRWGAPTVIVDAGNYTTRIDRTDPSVPALPTKVTHPTGWTVTAAYNARGNVARTKDATADSLSGRKNRVRLYTYPATGFVDSPTQVTDSGSVQRTWSYTYHATYGLTVTATDPRGHVTHYAYRPSSSGLRGVVDSVWEGNVQTWREVAAAHDTLDSLMNQTTRFVYDARGNVTQQTDPAGVTTSYVLDSIGRAARIYDAVSSLTMLTYDAMNRTTQRDEYTNPQTNPYGSGTGLAHCDTSQVLCRDVTSAHFDPGLADNTIPSIRTTQYVYNASGLSSVTDPRTVQRTYAYEGRGLVKAETDDYQHTQRAFYGPGGLLDSTLTRSGRTIRHSYDALGREYRIVYPAVSVTTFGSGPQTIPGDSVKRTFDALGSVTWAATARDTITRLYYGDGSLKQKLTKLVPFGTALVDTIRYTYDEFGARDSVVHGLDVTTYTYGLAGELTTMRVTPSALGGSRTLTFTFTSDSVGRIRRIQYPVQNITVDYRYDARGLLRRIVSRRPAAPGSSGADILDFVFRNDSVDALGRILREETVCTDVNTNTTVTGNPCGSTQAGHGPVGRARTYNRAGWLVLDADVNGVAPDSMQFDMSGNMTYRRKFGELAHTFTMDGVGGAHNRLTLDHYVQNGTQLDMYSWYDLDGNRIADTASTRDTGYYNDRATYYDGLGRLYTPIRHHQLSGGEVQWDPWAERCRYDPDGQAVVMCETPVAVALDGANHSGTLGTTPWRFFGDGALDSPLMGVQKTTTGTAALLFFVTDGAGRQFVAADSTGAQSLPLGIDGNWKYSGAAGTTASFDSDRLSAGQPAGIAYFRNRTYDMNTGRWMQEDPIGIAGGDNLYQFNGNNPVTFTDPFGLRPECCEEALPAVAEAALAIGAPPAALVIGLVAVGVAVAGNQNDHVVITTSIQAPADATAVHSRTNKVQPHPDAEGAHTGYKTDGGKVTGYTEFDADGNPRKRFRGTGRPHGGQEPPLILEPEPGKGPGSPPKVPRAPRPEELPRGY